MAIVTSFLCWDNTRTGSAVCAYYSLVMSVVCVSFYVFRYLAMGVIDTAVEYKSIVYPGFVLYTVMIAVSLVLLPGVYMDKRYLLLPWVYTLVVTVLYDTGAIALLTTVHLSKDKILKGWEISALCFYFVRLLANCYCFACVVSQYQELSEGRGTYDYLYKPRRRRLTHPLSDGDIYHPPYGAHLPPYTEVNVHKQFSPPEYHNITVVCDNHAFCTDTSTTLSTPSFMSSSFPVADSVPVCLDYDDLPHTDSHFQTLRLEIATPASPGQPSACDVRANDSNVRQSGDGVSESVGGISDVTERARHVRCVSEGTRRERGGGISEAHHHHLYSSKMDVYKATYVTWI